MSCAILRASIVTSFILGSETMADVSTWAEVVRNTTHKNTYNWHFTDIPVNASSYKPNRDCKLDPAKGDCSIAAPAAAESDPRRPQRGSHPAPRGPDVHRSHHGRHPSTPPLGG